jgi:hypothetical protein
MPTETARMRFRDPGMCGHSPCPGKHAACTGLKVALERPLSPQLHIHMSSPTVLTSTQQSITPIACRR